jgi:transcriptional regulator with XRE-family HTH domain
MRRIEIGMNQQILGGRLDLTFQQIQKYEKGTNGIGASRLQQIGKILKVPASYFFEDAPGGWGGRRQRPDDPDIFGVSRHAGRPSPDRRFLKSPTPNSGATS